MVSSITVLSLGGLVTGVAVLVLVLSILNGFERELRERVLSVVAHAVLTSPEPLVNWQATADEIKRHPEVVGVAPLEEIGGLVVSEGNVRGIQLSGVVPELEGAVSKIPEFVVQGSFDALETERFSAVIGVGLADQLGLEIGDPLTLILPEIAMTLAGPQPRTRRFKVVGIFKVGSDADKLQVFIHLRDALKLVRKPEVSSLRLAVTDLFDATRILQEVAMALPQSSWLGSSWLRRHGNLYNAIQTQKTTLFLLLLMLVAVAAFNLISNLVMIVNQRKGDIAIFRTMGATKGAVMQIFLWHGFTIGLLGIGLGLILGCLLAMFITPIYAALDNLLGLRLMDEYFIHYLPSQILLSDLMLIGGVSATICLLAATYPALAAAKTLPIEALRYE